MWEREIEKIRNFLRFSLYFVFFSFMFQFLLIGLECLFVCLASWKATKQAADLQMSSRFLYFFLFFFFTINSSTHSFESARGSRIHTLVMFVFVTLNSVWTEMWEMMMMPMSVLCLCLCILYSHTRYPIIHAYFLARKMVLTKQMWNTHFVFGNLFDFKPNENDWHIYSRQ